VSDGNEVMSCGCVALVNGTVLHCCLVQASQAVVFYFSLW